MSTKMDIPVVMSEREWSRLFSTGVVKSLCKTVTEPITNSDTSYKRLHGLSMDTGLISNALDFKKGTKFDVSALKKGLIGKSPDREIQIHLYTAQGHQHIPRTCEIVDFAEGLTSEEIRGAFQEYAADKSRISKSNPGRSLFGRGVSDVLFGHRSGLFTSYKDGVLTKALFSFNLKDKKSPHIKLTSDDKPTIKELKEFHFKKGVNATCVRFVLHDDCRIPDEGTLVPLLSQFYMLRLINADPNVVLNLFRYRSKKEVLVDRLEYDFPIGDVLQQFSFEIMDPVPGASLPPLEIQGIVCRAESKSGLPGREVGEQRANGLLIVDDKDAVLDQTLLPDYEMVPYLKGIFGVVRIKNIRSALDWFLNNGKDSPLTVSRDGLDTKHEFTRLLFDNLATVLKPIYKHEEERFHKGDDSEMSTESKKRMNDVVKLLNKFLEVSGGADGEDETNDIDLTKVLQFVPNKTRVIIGKPRNVKLFFKKEAAKREGAIVFDTENPKIVLTPSSCNISEGKIYGDYLAFEMTIKCDDLHETGSVRALAEGQDSDFDAHLKVLDVIPPPIVISPIEMEFRPENSKGAPSRKNNLTLLVNSTVIPINRKIKVRVDRAHGKIGLQGENALVDHLDFTLEKKHLIPGTQIGRILVPWRGSGWGQWAKIIAETKKTDGNIVKAEARIDVEQMPEENGGKIKEWKYRPLPYKKCSDLVDDKIYINSEHSLNNCVFGANQNDFNKATEMERTAQYRLSTLLVEQAVFAKAETMFIDNKVTMDEKSPVTSLRLVIDKLTDELAPRIVKILVKK